LTAVRVAEADDDEPRWRHRRESMNAIAVFPGRPKRSVETLEPEVLDRLLGICVCLTGSARPLTLRQVVATLLRQSGDA
jgi:hypothetical protein